MKVLEIKNLTVFYEVNGEYRKALKGVNLNLDKGETLSLIGESGAGKTTLALSIPGLLPENARVEGDIRVDGVSIFSMKERELMMMRRKKISIIFQEPGSCLMPGIKVGRQMMNVVRIRRGVESGSDIEKIAKDYLERVGLDVSRVWDLYPDELSGGMAQRVLIAMALCVEPVIVIADEPTSALDSVNQYLILNLIKELQREFNFGLLLISHDLRIAVNFSDRVAILKDGEIVEYGETLAVLKNPGHDYTRKLIEAALRMSVFA